MLILSADIHFTSGMPTKRLATDCMLTAEGCLPRQGFSDGVKRSAAERDRLGRAAHAGSCSWWVATSGIRRNRAGSAIASGSSERRRAEDLDRTGGLSGRTDPVEVDGRGVVLAGVPVERLACSRVLEGQHPGGR